MRAAERHASLTVWVVACGCAAAALPFGDVTYGWNFAVGPAAAATLEVFLLGPSHTLRRSLLAAAVTLASMLGAVVVIVAFWGL